MHLSWRKQWKGSPETQTRSGWTTLTRHVACGHLLSGNPLEGEGNTLPGKAIKEMTQIL